MANQTALTPGFGKISMNSAMANSKNEDADKSEYMRQIVLSMLEEGSIESALIIAKQTITYSNVSREDYILLARAYFLSGEFRKCLITLEQQDLLSISEIQNVLLWLEHLTKPSKDIDSRNMRQNLCNFSLAGQCLWKLEKFEDCIGLLDPFIHMEESVIESLSQNLNRLLVDLKSETNPLSSILCILGKCFDMLENRTDGIKYLCLSVRLDPTCVQAVDYMIEKRLISAKEKKELFESMVFGNEKSKYLESFYRENLLDDNESFNENFTSPVCNNSYSLIRQAERCFDLYLSDEAYKLARKAYYLDPADIRGLIIYIAAAVDLNLVSELYYIGHELTNSSPKLAISWYAVGCYYYCCQKFELAQKYLTKATKLDKRMTYAWVALGHCLSAQQESEHAVSAYRSAMRLSPGDYGPPLYIARELVRMSNYPMALHLLLNATIKESHDPQVLNEIGIILLRQERIAECMRYFHEAAKQVQEKFKFGAGSMWLPRSRDCCSVEIFSNYGFALRKSGEYEKSRQAYDVALSLNPQDPDLHCSIGFLYHVMRRFDKSISHYHSALALRPNLSLALELLQFALRDKETFEEYSHDTFA